ncbi:MAG: gamma-glutamyltransferase [Candidatus Eiseniibacteriota bacterium]|nr:MAG: gamma-glutamyltransferase [Candidatus Eisenbacteria bacterium]
MAHLESSYKGKPKPVRSKVPEPQRVSASRFGMIATAHWCATDAGREILEDGGNAVDAAVAAALALGVCEPAASGIGGQTMMLVHTAEPRRTLALDGSSRAPNRAAPEATKDSESRRRGHAATTVPSTLATLDYALRKYGTMKFSRVMEPAIRLAEEGYIVSSLQKRLAKRELKSLRESSAAQFFLDDGVRPYRAGRLFKQPVLAQTLRRLAEEGVTEFYQGEIARQMDADMQENGGLLRLDDLAQIPWPIERRPVSCHFAHHRVITFPPPGAGRTLVEMLQILSNFPSRLWNVDTPEGALVLVEVIRRAFLDRRDRPYDPTFYAQVDDRRMMSDEYAKRVANRIRRRVRPHGETFHVEEARRERARREGTEAGASREKENGKSGHEDAMRGETTHLSVMDRFGNAVALTQSIERVFGSFSASPELGFLYNNYMMAFEHEDIAHPYHLRPNAVPWASVAPTLVFRGRRPWVAIGSPGSELITPSILQVLLRLELQSPYDAVSAPRIHCDIEKTVSLEVARMRDDIPAFLEERGFSINPCEPFSFFLGCVQLVMYENKTFVGVADPRRDGSAGGPSR